MPKDFLVRLAPKDPQVPRVQQVLQVLRAQQELTVRQVQLVPRGQQGLMV